MDRKDPLFLPDPEISRLEFWVRAVCGAILGTFVGFYLSVRLHPSGTLWYVAIFIASVFGFAWGAVKYGDHFWNSLGRN